MNISPLMVTVAAMLPALIDSNTTVSDSTATVDGRVERRIIGGTEASVKQYPWIAALLMSSGSWCGGSVIAPEWLITSAHCFMNEEKVIDPNMRVMVSVAIDNLEEFERNEYPVDKQFTHPQWTSKSNDIALIKLKRPLNIGEGVEALKLPQKDEEKKYMERTNGVRLAGFGVGRENGSEPPQRLMAVHLTMLEDTKCLELFQFNSEQHICAGTQDGSRDACQGDSGNGLVAIDRNVILGIVSYGEGCGRRERPGVYTKVSSYLPWIESIIYSN